MSIDFIANEIISDPNPHQERQPSIESTSSTNKVERPSRLKRMTTQNFILSSLTSPISKQRKVADEKTVLQRQKSNLTEISVRNDYTGQSIISGVHMMMNVVLTLLVIGLAFMFSTSRNIATYRDVLYYPIFHFKLVIVLMFFIISHFFGNSAVIYRKSMIPQINDQLKKKGLII